MLYTSPWSRFELTTLVVIGNDCIDSCKSDYHTITTMMALSTIWKILVYNVIGKIYLRFFRKIGKLSVGEIGQLSLGEIGQLSLGKASDPYAAPRYPRHKCRHFLTMKKMQESKDQTSWHSSGKQGKERESELIVIIDISVATVLTEVVDVSVARRRKKEKHPWV